MLGFDCDASAKMFGVDFWALDAANVPNADEAVPVVFVVAGGCDFAARSKMFVLGAGDAGAAVLFPSIPELGLRTDDCAGAASAESGFVKLKDGLEAGVCEIGGAVLVAPRLKGDLADGVCEDAASVVLVLPKPENGLDWASADVGMVLPKFGVSCGDVALMEFANGLLGADVAPLILGVSCVEGVLDRDANGLLGDWGAPEVARLGTAAMAGCTVYSELALEQHK